MTTDELPSQPRKASWKRWTLAVACVLVIALAVLFLKAPAPEPVSVRFVGSTNYNGHKMLVFKGTNGVSKGRNADSGWITYTAGVVPTSVEKAQTIGLVSFYHGEASGWVDAGGTFTFSLDAPPKDTDWCVIWWASGIDLAGANHTHVIPSTDLKD